MSGEHRSPRFVDAHCHLHRFDEVETLLLEAERHGVRRLVVNGTSPADWAAVLALAAAHPDRVIPAIGLHPWFLADRPTDWLQRLRRFLQDHPTATVGEIGLDRTRRSPPLAEQIQPLRDQLSLAAELERTVTVHCVRCWGRLLEELGRARDGNQLPPVVLLHDFRADPAMVTAFADLGCFFSIGAEGARDQTLARAIPKERLFVESDAEPENGHRPGEIPTTFRILAEARSEDIAGLARQVDLNADRIFGQQSEGGPAE